MTMLASQINSLTVVYSIVYSGVNQRKHQSSASLAFVREIHRGPVNFPHKWPVTRKMFPFDELLSLHALGFIWLFDIKKHSWKNGLFISYFAGAHTTSDQYLWVASEYSIIQYTRTHLYNWHTIIYLKVTYIVHLTHLPMDKMAAILTDDIFNYMFLNVSDKISI